MASSVHPVLGTSFLPPFPKDCESVLFGMGCFWGAERLFWQMPGVYTTAVGYAGGHTVDPSYEAVCTGQTQHAEVVLVVYRQAPAAFEKLLKTFWQEHDPTQGMRQGNDIGSQYRSAIYCNTEIQLSAATESRNTYTRKLQQAGLGSITTEIALSPRFYYAEPYHQQYLHKVPHGYCGLAGTGVSL